MCPADAGPRRLGLFAFLYGTVSIASLSIVALITNEPFVFPSLGPTAFLIGSTPLQRVASPRNAICGHFIGVTAGYLSLVIFRLTGDASAFVEGVGWARVGAAALSLGLTSGLMIWLRVPHAPAGATTLIISLGVLREPWQLGVMMLAVVMLVAVGFVIHRAAGTPYPPWSPATDDPGIGPPDG